MSIATVSKHFVIIAFVTCLLLLLVAFPTFAQTWGSPVPQEIIDTGAFSPAEITAMERGENIMFSATQLAALEKIGITLGDVDSDILEEDALSPVSTDSEGTEGLSSCFDYYTFGSVEATVSAKRLSIAQGAVLPLIVTVKNTNPYPIVDARVYAKVFYVATTDKNVNGPDAVDFFPIGEQVTLKAGEQKTLISAWQAPISATPGAYRVATYVAASNRFNLRGLSFTDDIVGDIFDFNILGADKGAVRFDKSSVTVNGKPFYFAAFPPRVAADLTQVPVTAKIENTTEITSSVNVSWKLYAWDGLREDALLSSSEQTVLVPADQAITVSYDAPIESRQSVYYLVGEFKTDSGTSFINVRFVRDGVNVPRINDVAVNTYPGTEDTKAFVCFHSSGTATAENGKVVLTVRETGQDQLSRLFAPVLASATYEGNILGEIYALTAAFKHAAKNFDVTAELYQSGTLIDRVTVPYHCDTLGTCETGITKSSSSPLGTWIWWLIGVGVLTLILIIGFVIRFSRSKTVPLTNI